MSEKNSGYGVFDYIDAVTFSKKHIIRDSDTPDVVEKGYNSWITNKSLSYHSDAIMFANDMNRLNGLSNIQQFDYYINTLRKRKRFAKWAKPDKNDLIKEVMRLYKCSRQKALEYISILNEDQIGEIERINNTGEVEHGRSSNKKSGRK